MTREELADKFDGQADWRWQKFEEYPDDTRNRDASEIFHRLAATAAEVPNHLLAAYDAAFLRLKDTSGDMSSLIETESQLLRDVGFRSHPATATAWLEVFLELAAAENRRNPPYRPKLV